MHGLRLQMAPERMEDEFHDHTIDTWNCGLILRFLTAVDVVPHRISLTSRIFENLLHHRLGVSKLLLHVRFGTNFVLPFWR